VESIESGVQKELFPGDTARYLPTGHIIYAVENNLFAVPFDLGKLEVTDGPIPMQEGILRGGGAPQYDVSDSGTLVYMPLSGDLGVYYERTLVWVDSSGKEESIATPPDFYFHPRVSPDGTQVAVCSIGEGNTDIYIWNLVRETLTRLTFDPAEEDFPLWSPDGKRIAFYSEREGNRGINLKSADGTGSEELIRSFSGQSGFPGFWSDDGGSLLIQQRSGPNTYIGTLSMEGDREWKPLVQGNYVYAQPEISPDGHWLAYTSNESGRYEVYVRPYPEVDSGKWQVSTNGGDSALWSPDGRELFYRRGNEAMVVSVRTDPAFNMENPKILFEGVYESARFTPGNQEFSPWDIHPDGERFLMIKPSMGADIASTAVGPRDFVVVLNWFEELKQRVPVD
jgi:Tol biopolymer transport system component